MAIEKCGELIAYLETAAQEHGMTPHSDIFVRVGALGPVYRIDRLKGQADQRGIRFVLELDVLSMAME